MSILINNFEIINNGQAIAIDVETNVGYLITSIQLWTMDNFKDYSLSINVTDQLEQVNNSEVLIINAIDVGVEKFEDLMFVEIESNFIDEDVCEECITPALGITYNLSVYYNCLMDYILEMSATECLNCENKPSTKMTVTINLLIDAIEKAVQVGYYTQAIQMVNRLKKLCNIEKCKNCPTINCSSCNKFIQQ